MGRPLRLEYPGAVYHVMSRGHERAAMFRDDEDREQFLALLGVIAVREGWEVHGYCLLGNHYHLLVETPLGKLSQGMVSLNGRYARWFNRRHRRRGHFLEGRFRSVLVQKESHLLELLRYIVLNPVRARLVERAVDWKWSSYRATAGVWEAPQWLAVDWTLLQFARSRAAARKAFRRFVACADLGKRDEELEKSPYLGDQDFVTQVRRMLEGKQIPDEIPLRYRRLTHIGIEEVRTAVAREWRVSEQSLARRRGGDEKKAAVYLARQLTRLGGREVGAAFGVKAARVSHICGSIQSNSSSALVRRIARLQKQLEST
jgi:putative transposase